MGWLGYKDDFPMVSVVVCMIAYWIRPKWVMIEWLLGYVVWFFNLEGILC